MPTYSLAIDLSAPRGSLSLHDLTSGGEACLSQRSLERDHAQTLVPAIDSLLKSHSLSLSDLSCLVTTSGPGSFTGLRVAYSAFKAFAMALDLSVETVDAPEARALAWLNRNPQTPISECWVLTTLSAQKVVLNRFRREADRAIDLGEEIFEMGKTFSSAEKQTPVLGDGRIPQGFAISITETLTLCSRILVESLPLAKSRRTHKGIAEWIEMSPRYSASRF